MAIQNGDHVACQTPKRHTATFLQATLVARLNSGVSRHYSFSRNRSDVASAQRPFITPLACFHFQIAVSSTGVTFPELTRIGTPQLSGIYSQPTIHGMRRRLLCPKVPFGYQDRGLTE